MRWMRKGNVRGGCTYGKGIKVLCCAHRFNVIRTAKPTIDDPPRRDNLISCVGELHEDVVDTFGPALTV